MQIPARLSNLLGTAPALDGAVKLSVTAFQPWIATSNLPFFPEYTDHGITHLDAVLRTAVSLIRDEAWEPLTAADAAVLVLSVLLHDCAMHLSEVGFVALLQEPRRAQFVPGLGDRPWHELWEDFIGEASRFDGRKLTALFGDSSPAQRPPLDPNRMTRRDRLLIGEFLRRHHPRLALEIALFGVPGFGPKPLALIGFDDLTDHIPMMSGLVARSHGADLRRFLPFLEKEYHDLRSFRGTHAVFLMALLRVADYLQVDAVRAPRQVLQVTRLSSPVSQGEWKAHHAVLDVRHTHDDPEAVFIHAQPKDVETYFKLQSWCRGIQKELDVSWAVLGEVYGRFAPLNELGLVIRRVRSTLDDEARFAAGVDYLPRKARFRAADADLLKLLIGPLYGNRPEVGIRELMQNAVDAVREMEQHLKAVPSDESVERRTQEADVVVHLDKDEAGNYWLEVTDRGIGMSADVIVNYFLTAGASFRRSDEWRKQFEKAGRSQVLRAGRFGVGALAAFLLGTEMEVTTRHVTQSTGLSFKAGIESDTIELRKVPCAVGTQVRVRVEEKVFTALKEKQSGWDWYGLASPSMRRFIGKTSIERRVTAVGPEQSQRTPWRLLPVDGFDGVLWTFAPDAPNLLVNGIRVERNLKDDRYPYDRKRINTMFEWPYLSVLDSDGRLPLNLQRSDLADADYSFSDVIAQDINHDFLAHVLVNAPEQSYFYARYDEVYTDLRYPGFRGGHPNCWFMTVGGIGLLTAQLLSECATQTAVLFEYGGATSPFKPCAFDDTILLLCSTRGSQYPDKKKLQLVKTLSCLTNSQWDVYEREPMRHMAATGVRMLFTRPYQLYYAKDKLPKYLRGRLQFSEGENSCKVAVEGKCAPESRTYLDLANRITYGQASDAFLAELTLNRTLPKKPDSLSEAWMSILGHPIIPFDMGERRRKFKSAYRKLAPYIERHEYLRAQKPGKG